jgi:hypothetical protein
MLLLLLLLLMGIPLLLMSHSRVMNNCDFVGWQC